MNQTERSLVFGEKTNKSIYGIDIATIKTAHILSFPAVPDKIEERGKLESNEKFEAHIISNRTRRRNIADGFGAKQRQQKPSAKRKAAGCSRRTEKTERR